MKPSWKGNSSSSTLFIELYWYIPLLTLSNRQIAVSFAKRSSSSYKQTFTKFSKEKALSHSYFQIFKLQFATLGLPPLSPSQLPNTSNSSTNYWVTDRSSGSISPLPFTLSFLSLALLASVRSTPKRSAIPSRHHSSTNPFDPPAQKQRCIIYRIYVTKQNSTLYPWNG